MKYKVGDRVKIQSLERYNKYKNRYGDINYGCETEILFTSEMSSFCGQVATITRVRYIGCVRFYHLAEDKEAHLWVDGMFECLVGRNGKTYPYKIGDRVVLKGNNRCATITDLKYNSFGNLSYYIKIDNDKDISIDYPTDLLLPYDDIIECKVGEETKSHKNMCKQLIDEMNPNVEFETETHRGYYTTEPETTIEGKKRGVVYFWDNDFADKVELDLSDRELIQEDGKWFVVKKKKEYQKTYEECCKVVNTNSCIRLVYNLSDGQKYYHDEDNLYLYENFRRLKICRDAYWMIYGEENGLGKPWEPDWTIDDVKYSIFTIKGMLSKTRARYDGAILSFPTEEMRDAFYENFKKEIEICKELL